MLRCHIDDLLVAGRRGDVKEIFEELKRKVDVTYKEVTGSTTHVGRRHEIKDDEVIFSVGPKYVDNILEEIGLRALRGPPSSSGRKKKREKNQSLTDLARPSFAAWSASLCGWIARTSGRRSGSLRRSWATQCKCTAGIRCTSCAT